MMQVVEVPRSGSVESFFLSEREEASPGPRELQIRIKAASLQPFDSASGVVLGYDVAGIVQEVGEGVTDFRPGDEVWSYLGGPNSPTAYAESVCVPVEWASRMPVNLTFAEAAAVPTIGLCAYEAVLAKARLAPQEAVLVTGGSGPLGSMIIQLCRYRGAGPILATSGSERSFRELTERLKLPPEHVISYHGRSLDELGEQITSLCRGRDIRASFDLVGHRLSQLCYRSVGFGGSVVSVVNQPGSLAEEAAKCLFAKSATLHLEFIGARARFGGVEHWKVYHHYLQALTRLFEEGHLAPPKICDLGKFSAATIQGAHGLLPRIDALGQLVLRFR